MKVVIALDSFKGSMSSLEAGKAAKQGVLRSIPDAEVKVFPVADGGEGTVAALSYGRQRLVVRIPVTGPLGDKIEAEYSIIGNEAEVSEAEASEAEVSENNRSETDFTGLRTAVIEMSAAAGLPLIPQKLRNPMKTTTYGVGEMIRDAISKGCRDFIIGIGGSATNDAGTGMLAALGYEFLDAQGEQIGYGGAGLTKLSEIRGTNVLPDLSECHFRIACDVNNPLLGERGCSRIFARQKGASDEEIEMLEQAVRGFADLTERHDGETKTYGFPASDVRVTDNSPSLKKGVICTDSNGKFNRNSEGAGAAGGLGYAFLMYTDAVLMRGIDIVTEYIGIEDDIKAADLVITGEGKIDAQTMMGKTPSGIAAIAKKYAVPVYAFAGMIDNSGQVCLEAGLFDKMFQLKRENDIPEELMKTEVSMRRLCEEVEDALWQK